MDKSVTTKQRDQRRLEKVISRLLLAVDRTAQAAEEARKARNELVAIVGKGGGTNA